MGPECRGSCDVGIPQDARRDRIAAASVHGDGGRYLELPIRSIGLWHFRSPDCVQTGNVGAGGAYTVVGVFEAGVALWWACSTVSSVGC